MRMFVDFVADTTGINDKEHDPSRFPSCPCDHWQNIKVEGLAAVAIIFPGGPNFHDYGAPLEYPIFRPSASDADSE